MDDRSPSLRTPRQLDTLRSLHFFSLSRGYHCWEEQHAPALVGSGILPLSAPTRLSPHMTAIAFCDPPNLEAYDIPARNVKTNLNLCTPIFFIHVLHFATARLDVPLLQHLITNPNTPPNAAGTTALDHTLLHVSTLPLNDKHINIFSPKNFQSIH